MTQRVIVAMSGGVDSSVALLQVAEAGYEAIGVTMKLWEYRDVGGNLLGESSCCPVEAVNSARDVCVSLGIPHHTLDFQAVFKTTVVDNFIDEYIAGRTPNPCVRCNSYVKWDALIKQADQLGADKIATGHYARIDVSTDAQPRLLKGLDTHKDQSYVLWGIPRETLARTLFPLGSMTKEQVRQLARKHGLTTAETPESQEICFVADNDYRRFLDQYANGRVSTKVGLGEIVDEDGRIVGQHPGYAYYTIGQRRGLGLAAEEPLYVKELDPEANRITVAPRSALYSSVCELEDVNWLVDRPDTPRRVHAQIRYNSEAASAQLIPMDALVRLEFEQAQLAITPGQSAVFYDGDTLMGGGIIRRGIET
ncbi:MAG: tRNA 2-thiouridine(34) synthase MnmA [Fidelibacterota bacterium]|nr:MAG: tRNA 2-thiouridine(34) synthase MnmA [Candidatus Neomarinimicrobiota bacterium]